MTNQHKEKIKELLDQLSEKQIEILYYMIVKITE